MERWEPWVRATVAIGEMLQGITFQKSGNGFQVLSSGNLIAEIQRPRAGDVRESDSAGSQLGRNCATNAPPKSWRRSIRNTRSGRRSSTCIRNGPDAHWSSSTWCYSSASMWRCASNTRWRATARSNTTREVQPMITTPGHNSFPMGHATQAYAVAHVLKKLLDLDPVQHPPHKWVIDQARPSVGAHHDQPRHRRSPFSGRQHGRAHAGRGARRVFLRALHR